MTERKDLADLTLAEFAAGYRRGEWSSEEVTAAVLDRLVSQAHRLEFKGESHVVEEMRPEAFEEIDLVIASTPDEVSAEFAPWAVERGAVVVDESGYWRMDPKVPLVVPEVNPDHTALIDVQRQQRGWKGLIVTSDVNESLYLASRNIPGVYTVDVSGIDPVSLVAAEKVILTVDAVEKIQEWLG